jgi:hypothetical protein
MTTFGFNPSAEQHAKMQCCMTPQVLKVPLANKRSLLGGLCQLDVGKKMLAQAAYSRRITE